MTPAPMAAAPPAQPQAQALDPQVVAMAKAIRQTESGNKPVSGASGEQGRYQFMPGTWHAGAAQYLGDGNAPQSLENENKVAYSKIKAWKDQGYNPGQIASLWNSGSPQFEGKVGTNKFGVHYDTPAYVQKVYANYQQFKPQGQDQTQQPDVQSQSQVPQQPQPTLMDKIGQATDPTQLGIGAVKGVGSTLSGLESLGEKYLTRPIDKAISWLTGKPSVLPTSGPTEGENFAQQHLQANGLAQKIGKGAEQIGELFLPTGLEEAGANLASKIAPKAPELAQGALRLGGKALGAGVDFGTKAAAQTGSLKEGLKAGAFGAAATPLAEGVGAAVGHFAPKLADTLEKINLRLTPTQKTNLGPKIDSVVKFIGDEVGAGTPEMRLNKVSGIYDKAEGDLQDFLTKDMAGVSVPKQDVVAQLEALKPQYANERDALAIEKQIDEAISTINAKQADAIPVSNLNQLKRSTYSNAYNKAGNKVLDTVEHDIGDVFRTNIEKATEATGKKINGLSVADFNKRYGTIINAKKLLKAASGRAEIGLVGKIVSSIIGEHLGGAVGGPIGGAIGAGVGSTVAKGVAGTAARSTAAGLLRKTAGAVTPSTIQGGARLLSPLIRARKNP